MDLRELEYFLMVAEELNFTRAAQNLHVSQPTLSRQIAQLEETLGATLLNRNNKVLELTEEGFLLKRRAQEMLELYEKTTQEIKRNSSENIEGTISIGVGVLKSVSLLITMIREFRKKYPLVNFDILTITADVASERLEQGLLDVGMLIEPVSLEKFNYLRMPGREEMGVLMRDDDVLADKDNIKPTDLLNKPLIFPNRLSVRKELESWFGRYYKKINVPFTSNLPMNAEVMVSQGLGYSLVVIIDTENWNYKHLVHKPLNPPLYSHAVLAWKKQQPASPALEKFIDFCHEYLENMRNYVVNAYDLGK